MGSGKYDCYHHVTNESFHFDYSVEGGGNLDIIFEAFNHKEEKIVEFPKNATGYHLFKEIGQKSRQNVIFYASVGFCVDSFCKGKVNLTLTYFDHSQDD